MEDNTFQVEFTASQVYDLQMFLSHMVLEKSTEDPMLSNSARDLYDTLLVEMATEGFNTQLEKETKEAMEEFQEMAPDFAGSNGDSDETEFNGRGVQ